MWVFGKQNLHYCNDYYLYSLNTCLYFLFAMNEKLFSLNKDGFIKPFQLRCNRGVDKLLLFTVILLALFGTVMVFSAGEPYAYARYNDGAYFKKRQILWLCLGFLTMYLASHVKPGFYKSITPIFYVLTLLLLVLVLALGFVGNGAKRWIAIGPVTVQPSEIAKISIVLILAKYFSDYESLSLEQKKNKRIFLYGTIFPIILMLVPIVLVMLQKHLSCIIILGTLGLLMIVGSGANLKYISSFCIVGASGVAALALFTDYTKDRITVWRDPEAYKPQPPLFLPQPP